nr:MAG TPA: hypothetical protein [Caudoviricetes sp.]
MVSDSSLVSAVQEIARLEILDDKAHASFLETDFLPAHNGRQEV